jgi:folate-binding protein YgfZ
VNDAEVAGSLAEQDRVLRQAVGAVALERDVVRVSGADAVGYLQGQCSQDVEQLAVGASADALLLSPQGKLHSLVRVTRLAGDELLVDVDGGYGPAVAERLLRFRLRVKVEVELLPWRCVALRGPEAAAAAARPAAGATAHPAAGATAHPAAGAADRVAGAADGLVVVPFTWPGAAGVDLLGVAPTVPDGVPRCSLSAWQALRIEAGVPAMGAELDERTIPAEAGLVERAVSLTKGCYTGQELVARLDARGSRVARHLRGLVVAGLRSADDAGPETVPPPGTAVRVGDRVVGTVTSSAWSPGRGAVALTYLHRSVEPPAQVELVDEDGTVLGRAEARTLPMG